MTAPMPAMITHRLGQFETEFSTMTQFLHLLAEDDKAQALRKICTRRRQGESDSRHFEMAPGSFDAVPGKPFAYWVSEAVRETFDRLPACQDSASVTSGTGTLDDFRFLRIWWEFVSQGSVKKWFPFAKGGAFASIYYDHHLSINWADDGAQMRAWIVFRYGGGHWARNIRSTEHYFCPGLTWPRRTNGLSFRVMPAGCIFADKSPAAFVVNDDPDELFALSCLLNSCAFELLVSVQLARTELAQSYEVGLIQQTPIPLLTTEQRQQLATLARRACLIEKVLETVFNDRSPNTDSHRWLQRDFFAFHLKHYSKSRRKAPIYWPLSTASNNYTIWLYYHRFTRDTFYKALNDYAIPKLQHEERNLADLIQSVGTNATASQRKAIAEQETLVQELRAFRDEMTRIAPLWNPDLNDGVIINFAPLWRLIAYRP